MSAKVETAIGSFPEKKRILTGKSPVILQAQIDGFVPLNTPDELKQWQEDLKRLTGISLDASRMAGIAGECCSAGCSDQCDLLA